MDSNQIEIIKNKIKSKIEVGDYITLSKILNTKRNTAVSRFNRNERNAVLIMSRIVLEKSNLIKKLKKYADNL